MEKQGITKLGFNQKQMILLIALPVLLVTTYLAYGSLAA